MKRIKLNFIIIYNNNIFLNNNCIGLYTTVSFRFLPLQRLFGDHSNICFKSPKRWKWWPTANPPRPVQFTLLWSTTIFRWSSIMEQGLPFANSVGCRVNSHLSDIIHPLVLIKEKIKKRWAGVGCELQQLELGKWHVRISRAERERGNLWWLACMWSQDGKLHLIFQTCHSLATPLYCPRTSCFQLGIYQLHAKQETKSWKPIEEKLQNSLSTLPWKFWIIY